MTTKKKTKATKAKSKVLHKTHVKPASKADLSLLRDIFAEEYYNCWNTKTHRANVIRSFHDLLSTELGKPPLDLDED